MDKLIDGVRDFHRNQSEGVKPQLEILMRDGQRPHAMFLTCSDSRILPEFITNAEPGDIFMVRNVGNLVPRPEDAWEGGDSSIGAALDYALDVLHVKDIVIMGHGGCGAMKALVESRLESPRGHISDWLKNGRLSLSRYEAGQFDDLEIPVEDRLSQINVVAQMDHLADYLSVRRRLDRMEVSLHGWWFDIARAQVLAYDAFGGKFIPMEEAYAGDREERGVFGRTA